MAALAWPAPARARNRRAGRAGNGDRPAVGVKVGRRWARGPVVVDGHRPPDQAGPGGRIGPRLERPLAGPGQPIRRGMLEDEARAGAGVEVFVRDGVGQAAGSMDHRRGAIAQGDHLALAARFEPAGHEEQVGAGVDPAGHHPIESLIQDDPAGAPPGEGPEGRRQCRIATALDDQPGAGRQELRRSLGQEIETLLRIEPANHPQDGPVVARIEANPLEQVGPTDQLAGRIQERVGRREIGISRRVPDRRVDPVEDPEEARPAGHVALGGLPAQDLVQPEAELAGKRLGRKRGADRVDEIGPLDARPEEIDPRCAPGYHGVARDEAKPREVRPLDPAVIGEVVDRQDRGEPAPAHDRIGRVEAIAEDERGRGVPVVDVEQVDRPSLGPERLQRRPPEQAEAPGVVRVTVDRVPIEGGREIDEPEPVAVGQHRADDHHPHALGVGLGRRPVRPGHGHPELLLGDAGGQGDGAVRRQEDVHRSVERAGPSKATSQGVDDIAQAAGLCPGFAFGSDGHDMHGAIVDESGVRWRGRDASAGGVARLARSRAYHSPRMDPLVHVPTLPGAPFRLPPQVEGLRRLAYNLYWSWHPRAKVLFNRIDAAAWTRYRNPVAVLEGAVDWRTLLEDQDFLVEYQAVIADLDAYVANGRNHWFQRHYARSLEGPIAYFCAEYGFYESLGIYSGGLGVLAGDHLKTASDMALPFIGVGLLYRKGYFRQTIDADGHQEHAYPDYDLARLPVLRAADRYGDPLTVTIELPGRTLHVAVWVAQVGRVPTLLLDTDINENNDADRPISHILYVRGREMRLHQELVLGVAGTRAIRALGISPAVWHLNEGHSAFLLAERARELVAGGATFDTAFEHVRSTSVFTIHTPVSAGNERFDADLVRRVAGPLLGVDRPEAAGFVDMEKLLLLGRGVDDDPRQFDMTALSLRLSCAANAVSQLHAVTANATWAPVLGERRILGITNGVHAPTWVGTEMNGLYANILGADLDDLDPQTKAGRFWERLGRIPDRDLWAAHQRQKSELAMFARKRLRSQFARHGEAPVVLEQLEEALDPEILTIGFARRFATYKRAGLLFTDVERLARLLWHPERPVQIVFAGKAHPADRPGQGVIQQIFERSRSAALRDRVFILEDYDMRIARFLVQGVDVWLNNPRRPLEASGTSGIKAAQNGVINASVLDGWWDEGWTGDNGWAIGGREQNPDEGAQDWADALDLYRILEDEIVPSYYERDQNGIPTGWTERMRNSIASTIWRFSTTRMLHEYTEELYLPAAGVTIAGQAERNLTEPAPASLGAG